MLLHTSLIFSQATFQKTFGGSGNEVGTWVTETTGGFLIAGNVTNVSGNQDALLMLVDSLGKPIWQRRFGAAQIDGFNVAEQTLDGGFVAVGETRSLGSASSDIFIVKVTATGTVVWTKTLGSATHDDFAQSITMLSDGDFVISGHTSLPNNANSSAVFIRLNQHGSTVWSKTYTSNTSNQLLSNYADGNMLYASGQVDGDAAFIRINLASGEVLGTKAYSGNSTACLLYQQPTQDGYLVLADHRMSNQNGMTVDMWVQKTNPNNGQVLWSKVYHRANANLRGKIEKMSDGGFLMVPYDYFNTAQADALLAKIDANGQIIWSYNYGGGAFDRFMKAQQCSDGGIIAIGETRSNSFNGNSDILFVKTKANGRIEGSCTWDAGIVPEDFNPTNTSVQASASNWSQPLALATNPLPINLVSTNFAPNPSPVVMQNIPLCPNRSFKVGGVDYFAPKMVSDTLRHLNGCDTIVHYNLTLTSYNTETNIIGLCQGETYTINGISYSAPYTVMDTAFASNTNACDTLVSYILKVWAQPTINQTIEFCSGETVMIGGQTYTQAGTVQGSIPSASGICDTLVIYTLIERPLTTDAVVLTFCPGESVMIGGQAYIQQGIVQSMIPNPVGGCDILVTYTLKHRPQPVRSEQVSLCQGAVYNLAGETYTQSTTVVINVPSTTGGCDTAVTYTLDWRPQPTLNQTVGICAGQSVVIGGQTYTQPGTFSATVAGQNGACDTMVTYMLVDRPQVSLSESVGFCPGQSVTIGGQTYDQPSTVNAALVGQQGECDTLVTYTLFERSQVSRAETIQFCSGESVNIGNQTYTQAGTVSAILPANNGGCDTLVTYTLDLRPQIARSETRGFCPGEVVLIGGQAYQQPGVVTLKVPSLSGGCDTIVTYTLEYLTPAPSNIAVQCPQDLVLTVTPGENALSVQYADPIAASDCTCPGLDITRIEGLPSGSVFPAGSSKVCYQIKDNCGQEVACCFAIQVRDESACDVKETDCIRYELLGLSMDGIRNTTYRIRVTNKCVEKLIYTAIEIPDGIITRSPVNNAIFTADSDRKYMVRSPNHSPMYSIRFKSVGEGISNGQSEVFEYTLPPQTELTHLNVTSRLDNHTFYEAHLNTFYCPVGVTAPQTSANSRDAANVAQQNALLLYPNPNKGVFYADLADWYGQKVQIVITNTQGQQIHTLSVTAPDDVLRIDMPGNASTGTYFMEVRPEKGEKEVLRFMLQR